MLKAWRVLALGCAAATLAHAASGDKRIDLDRPSAGDYLSVVKARSVQDILSHPDSSSNQEYVAGLHDGLLFNGSSVDQIDGVTWRIYWLHSSEQACLPINLPVTFQILVDPVRDFVRERPADASSAFITVLPAALSQAYPCPTSMR
jgi:hypothetical protein